MSRLKHVARAALFALGALLLPSVSHAADFLAGDGEVGECSEQQYLTRISERFKHQVYNVPNLPHVWITDFQKIHEHRYEPERETWPIARRYCGATVVLSDGHRRDLWYLIEDKMGFVGFGDNVEFCVSGFDRWYVYNGRCRVLR
jgi:hypothetical protein